MKINNVLVGTDPEVFITRDGAPYPICGLLGGTKEEPLTILDGTFAVQEDNVMAEFCVPPTNNSTAMYENIQKALAYIQKRLPEFNILIAPSAHFTPTLLMENPKALEFGCDPDYNVWNMRTNHVNVEEADPTLRTCGGHVHIGYDSPNLNTNLAIIKAMDLFLGVPSIVLDNDPERRILYGKAGAFRVKPYGVEYRVLSNFWIAEQYLVDWLFQSVKLAIDFVNQEKTITEETAGLVIRCINTSDLDLANYLITNHGLLLPTVSEPVQITV